jgi:hypothetical protein
MRTKVRRFRLFREIVNLRLVLGSKSRMFLSAEAAIIMPFKLEKLASKKDLFPGISFLIALTFKSKIFIV